MENSEYDNLIQIAKKERNENQKFLKSINDESVLLNKQFQLENHKKATDSIDCLQCANCCKTTPALLLEEDMDRISGYLKISRSEFVREYVTIDEDGDWVYKNTPCSFLNADNTCKIYEVRPNACRQFPHTDDENFKEITEITLENSLICPITAKMLMLLKSNILE